MAHQGIPTKCHIGKAQQLATTVTAQHCEPPEVLAFETIAGECVIARFGSNPTEYDTLKR